MVVEQDRADSWVNLTINDHLLILAVDLHLADLVKHLKD